MDIVDVVPGSRIAQLVRLVGSRKRRAMMAPRRNEVYISGTSWSGGSRSSWYRIRLSDNHVEPLAHYAPAQFGGPAEPPRLLLQPGTVVVEAGVFQGRPATPVIYVHPNETEL